MPSRPSPADPGSAACTGNGKAAGHGSAPDRCGLRRSRRVGRRRRRAPRGRSTGVGRRRRCRRSDRRRREFGLPDPARVGLVAEGVVERAAVLRAAAVALAVGADDEQRVVEGHPASLSRRGPRRSRIRQVARDGRPRVRRTAPRPAPTSEPDPTTPVRTAFGLLEEGRRDGRTGALPHVLLEPVGEEARRRARRDPRGRGTRA